MTYEGSSKIGHALFRSTVVAILPVASVKPTHVFGLAGDDTNRHATTNDFAVGGEIRFDSESVLGLRQIQFANL